MSDEKFIGKIRTSGKGVGYLRLPNLKEHIEINLENLNTALDLDEVEIEITKRKLDFFEGKVTKIIKRNKIVWVGVIKDIYNEEIKKKEKVFIADNFRFYPKTVILNFKKFNNLKNNEKILVELVEWENSKMPAKIKIKEVLGIVGQNETEMKAAVLDKGLILGFSSEVEKFAQDIKNKSKELIENDKKNRKDLTHLNVFTIDPADAKDFDDALHIRNLENGNIEVGVHIADPSFFVKKYSPLDKEAQKRATSIYLVDRTIPMFPEILSNDLCSLNPNEEKMAFSLIFELNEEAKVVSEWFGKTIIISKRRFDYLEAQEIINKNQGDYVKELKMLLKLSEIRRKDRIKSGSVEFHSVEPKFKMDKNMFPYEIYIKPRVKTMEMIEEFMLLANKRISMFISLEKNGENTKNFFIYRTHAKPKREKILEVLDFLKKFNIYPDTDNDNNLSAGEINKVLKKFKGKLEESILSLSILRSMQKAEYSSQHTGHFGLAFPYYTHFTSPIRRYPDIIAHRLALKYLNGEEISIKEKIEIKTWAKHCSEMEQKAIEAERDSISFKYTQYYSVRIGEKFSGIITGIIKFGFFVEDENTKAQGMVNVRNMGNDFFEYYEKTQYLKGKNTNKIFKLGIRVEAEVIGVDIEKRKIELRLAKI